MKKTTLLIIVGFILINQSLVAFADDPPSPNPPKSYQELTTSQEQANEKKEEIERVQRESQAYINRLKVELASAEGEKKVSIENEIKAEEAQITKNNSELTNLNTAIKTLDGQIQQTTEYKVSQIQERYEQLHKGTLFKGIDLIEESEACGDCPKKDIIQMQLLANQEYSFFLQTREQLELCLVKPECTDDQRKELENKMNQQAELVRNALKVLTDEELKLNVEKTFNVSKVFSLKENENDKKKELRDVVDTIADWLIMLVSSLAVTTLIIGGFMMIISGGDENRLETGKTIFIYSLIGLTVTLLSFGMITFIQSLFY